MIRKLRNGGIRLEPLLLTPIAVYHCDFPTKFGLPRQSGLAKELQGRIVFTPDFSNPDYIRGIEAYSHLWLLWQFSEAEGFSPTVRPPKLGGNIRVGVFASRSPFRPNPIGLSCVRLCAVENTGAGVALRVSGGDLMDGTPLFDIKPYLPYADAHPDASNGFALPGDQAALHVVFPAALQALLPQSLLPALTEALAQDPRPGYHNDPHREYFMRYAQFDIGFCADDETLTVTTVRRCE